MNSSEIKKITQPGESAPETAAAPEKRSEKAEQHPLSPERALESAVETGEIMDVKKQAFLESSVALTAEVLSAHDLSPAELQAVMDENHTAGRLADLDMQADRMAEESKQRIAEKMKTLPVNEQEGFDPEKALARIRQLPREQKGLALAEYKSELAGQKTALARLHTRLEEKIRKNPDAEFSELWQEVRRASDVHHFSVQQTDTIAEILHTYKYKRAAVKAAFERFKDDPEGLYQFALGKKPEGKIRAEIGPMNIHFLCNDFEDYAHAWGDDKEGRKKARLSGGVSLGSAEEDSLAGTLTLEKTTLVNRIFHPGGDKDLQAHEEQHAIHRLFTDVKIQREVLNLAMKKVSTVEQKAGLFASYIRTVRWNWLSDSKDEILAYIKDGTGKWETYAYLAHSDLYRHMDGPMKGFKNWVKENGQEFLDSASESIKQVFTAEYRQIMKDGLDAYQSLTKMGKSQAEALALLEHEPLQRWPKVVERLKQAAGREKLF